jgi:GT2 family glycosyltransferase
MFFSVIVPTFNRPDSLRRCLAALAHLRFPRGDYNVIVVDDGGSVDLRDIVATFEPRVSVTLIRQSNGGPARARNTGAMKATGRFLVFTDDDCQPTEGWLCALRQTFEANRDAVIGGRVINGLLANRYAIASQIIDDYCRSYFNRDLTEPTFFPSNNLALRKELYERIGGFDATFKLNAGEDRDFCERCLGHGLKLVNSPDAIVAHCHQMGLRGFWRQHFNYGRGGWSYSVAHRKRNRGHVRFKGLRFHFGLALAPLRMTQAGSALRLSALTFLSQIAVAAGYATEALYPFAPSR